MKYLFLILSFLLFAGLYSVSYAAYPMQHTSEPMAAAPVPQEAFHDKIKAAVHKLTTPLPAVEGSQAGDGTIGIVSFALGIGGLALIIASGVGAPILGLLGIACGIGAIVTGAMGFKQRNRGWAVAGFVLGVLEVLILVLAVALAIVFLNNLK
jgi:hypothetical protein